MTAMQWLNQIVRKSARPAADCRRRGPKRSLFENLEQRYLLSGGPIQVTNGNAFGPGSLAAAISQADSSPGSTISFAHGVSHVILGGSTLPAITASTTINGGKGVTITQNGTEPIFDITAGTVVLNGLTTSGGNAGTGVGGAVYDDSSSTVTLQNDSFYNNTATFGGAVFGDVGAGPLVISCCTFSYNTASSGGAVAYQGTGTLSVASSTFTHNTANDSTGDGAFGGAIAIGSFAAPVVTGVQHATKQSQPTATGTLDVSGSTFSYNQANGAAGSTDELDGDEAEGGAIYVNPETSEAGVQPAQAGPSTALTTISTSTFTYNTARGGNGAASAGAGGGFGGSAYGGAVAASGTLNVISSTFSYNQALGGSGGPDANNPDTAPTGTSFQPDQDEENSGGGDASGGALEGYVITITGCSSFTYNLAVGGAGGSAVLDSGSDGANGGEGTGGAIEAENTLTIGTTSSSSSSSWGYGAGRGTSSTSTQVTFAHNQATGGAGGSGDSEAGSSGGDGGAAFGGAIYADSAAISGCTTYTCNVATGGAGGTGYVDGDGGNGGQAGGGAIAVAALTLSGGTFTSNAVQGGAGGGGGVDGLGAGTGGDGGDADGGAIVILDYAGVTISASTFTKNAATGGAGGSGFSDGGFGGDADGGAIYLGAYLSIGDPTGSASTNFSSLTFCNNVATGGAGGVYDGDDDGGGDGGDANGGAIYVLTETTFSLSSSTFTNNQALGGPAGTANNGTGGVGGDASGGGLFFDGFADIVNGVVAAEVPPTGMRHADQRPVLRQSSHRRTGGQRRRG